MTCFCRLVRALGERQWEEVSQRRNGKGELMLFKMVYLRSDLFNKHFFHIYYVLFTVVNNLINCILKGCHYFLHPSDEELKYKEY